MAPPHPASKRQVARHDWAIMAGRSGNMEAREEVGVGCIKGNLMTYCNHLTLSPVCNAATNNATDRQADRGRAEEGRRDW